MEKKILIIEDSQFDYELMLRELNMMEQDFEVKLATTKPDFEVLLSKWVPDLIISDYDLKTFSGTENLIHAKKVIPGIPVVILSGDITREQEIALLKNRANDVLTKDNLKRLPFAIKRILNEQKDKKKLTNTLAELEENLKFQEALAEISVKLNSLGSFTKKINQVIKKLGETVNVSRVYIFEDFNSGNNTRNTFEWCADGVAPEIENLQNLDYKNDMPSLKPLLVNDGLMAAEDIHDLPADMVEVLEPQNIKSLIVYPISVGEVFYGFIGFDEVRKKRAWTKSEDKLIKSISGLVSNAFSEYKSEQKLKKSNKKLNRLLDEKELLVGEVHHRVKNNLALISGFLQLDQMDLGIKDRDEIISANILRIKSIAIIHELVYELGNFSDISVSETVKKVLIVSFIQERIQDVQVNITTSNKGIKFNINQAVPLSLLLSEMIFEIFRFKGDKKYKPAEELRVNIFQDDVNIRINLIDKELARVADLLLKENDQNFSEIFNVLAKQLGASIEISRNRESVIIGFEYRDVKGSSSALTK
ncbi:MAG: histidine kinase dimerization/phosphoacceptor domain -containing protein [Balneola sp.]